MWLQLILLLLGKLSRSVFIIVGEPVPGAETFYREPEPGPVNKTGVVKPYLVEAGSELEPIKIH